MQTGIANTIAVINRSLALIIRSSGFFQDDGSLVLLVAALQAALVLSGNKHL
ncbi:MAG TPA: hypothetical protein VFU09_10470 [Candidatus Udaeobacter sp.]|nr:hypothetical protein [Candidatus Udaeobacter sp.]